jgi:hypothetical protein
MTEQKVIALDSQLHMRLVIETRVAFEHIYRLTLLVAQVTTGATQRHYLLGHR